MIFKFSKGIQQIKHIYKHGRCTNSQHSDSTRPVPHASTSRPRASKHHFANAKSPGRQKLGSDKYIYIEINMLYCVYVYIYMYNVSQQTTATIAMFVMLPVWIEDPNPPSWKSRSGEKTPRQSPAKKHVKASGFRESLLFPPRRRASGFARKCPGPALTTVGCPRGHHRMLGSGIGNHPDKDVLKPQIERHQPNQSINQKSTRQKPMDPQQ